MNRLATIAALAAIALTAACGSQPDAPASDPNAFRILAGSELKDLEPQIVEAAGRIGITVVFENAGTLDVIDRINGGARPAAAWVANGAYAGLALAARPTASTKTMYSQVLIGMKPQAAHALGWDAKAPTWADVAGAASTGRFRYAMANPAASNSGLSALVSVATSLAGKGDGLASVDVHADALRGFLKGQALTAGSSGWLSDSYAADSSGVDGIINYESSLLELSRRPETPLVIVAPADGAVTADYPLMLIDPSRRADYDRLAALLTSAAQQRVFAAAGRRPVDPSVPASPALPPSSSVDMPFPARLDAVDALLSAYLDKLRRPVRSWFVLDRSGSMEGDRLSDMKLAMTGLVQGDPRTLAGRYARLVDRETATLVTFSGSVDTPKAYAIDRTGAGRRGMLADVSRIEAEGGTDLYEAVAVAMREAIAQQAKDPGSVYSIVLMTDGEANEGMDEQEFERFLASLPPSRRAVRVFPILFGEANVAAMERIAQITGGRTFDARKGGLSAVFRDIRGYQ